MNIKRKIKLRQAVEAYGVKGTACTKQQWHEKSWWSWNLNTDSLILRIIVNFVDVVIALIMLILKGESLHFWNTQGNIYGWICMFGICCKIIKGGQWLE